MGILANIAGVRPLEKSLVDRPDGAQEPRSPNIDPYNLSLYDTDKVYDGGHPGAGGAGYSFLRWAGAHPFVGSIKRTRINQAFGYFQPREDDLAPGMMVRLVDSRQKMTRAAQKQAREIMSVLLSASNGYGEWETFGDAAGAMLDDSLTLDQANAEVLFTRGGKPYGFMPVDASLVRLTKPTQEELSSGKFYPGADDARYVKLWENDKTVAAEFKRHEMIFGVRRHRTWEGVRGYGYPEIEEANVILTDLVDAMTFNSVNFKSGIHASTALAINSTMKKEQIYAMQNAIRAMLTGRRQSHKLPMFFLKPDDKMSGIPLSKSNKDMEFSQYLNFLLKVLCAVYQMDPAELGFVMGAEGVQSALSTSGPGERILFSKEKGFTSMMSALSWWLTSRIVRQINPDFVLEFVGMDAPSEEARFKRLLESARVFRTPNELRVMYDLQELDHPAAKTPLDQAFRDAAMGAEGAPAEGGEEDPFAALLGKSTGFAQGLKMGSMDQWTTDLVKAADRAMKDGIISKPHQRASMYHFVPSGRSDVLGHFVAADFKPWQDFTEGARV